MASFLSDVTHGKLNTRKEEVEPTSVLGINCVADVEAYIRAVALCTTSTAAGVERRIWCAEQDGVICVRSYATNEPRFLVENKDKVFVGALQAVEPHVWACLTDGYIRVFDVDTCQMELEFKAHGSAVTCVLRVGTFVLTGARDWTIAKWDPATYRCLFRYTGHQNSVRSLAFDSQRNVLFSGGDDATIRCWSLEDNVENVDPWPLVGHTNSVIGIVVHDVVVVSASADGTVKAWNIYTGNLIKNVDTREGAVTCLVYNESNNRIWVGGTDGLINVFDADTLDLMAKLPDHSGSYVVGIVPLVRTNELNVWCLTKKGVTRLWRESDGFGDVTVAPQLDAHQAAIDELRNHVINNFDTLEDNRVLLGKLESRDLKVKKRFAQAFSGNQRGLKARYYRKLIMWIDTRRNRRHRYHVAERYYLAQKGEMLQRYFKTFMKYTSYAREKRMRANLSESLLNHCEKMTARRFIEALMGYAKRAAYQRGRLQTADDFMSTTRRGVLCIYMRKWRRWNDGMRVSKKRQNMAELVLGGFDRGLIAVYWEKMVQGVNRRRRIDRLKEAAAMMLSRSGEQTMFLCYRRWLRYRGVMRQLRSKRLFVINLLSTFQSYALRISSFVRWKEWSKKHHDEVMAADTAKLRQEIEALEMSVDESSPSKEQILAELQQVTALVADAKKTGEDLDARIGDVEKQCTDIQRDLCIFYKRDPTVTPQAAFPEMMRLLKAYAVNCFRDYKLIAGVRDAGLSKAPPVKIYTKSLRNIRDKLWKHMDPEAVPRPKNKGDPEPMDWSTRPHMVDDMERAEQLQLKAHVREILVARDMMPPDDLTHAEEMVTNADVLFYAVMMKPAPPPTLESEDASITLSPLTSVASFNAPSPRRPSNAPTPASPKGPATPRRPSTTPTPTPAPKTAAPKPSAKPAPKPTAPSPKTAKAPAPKTVAPKPSVKPTAKPAAKPAAKPTAKPAAKAAAPK